MKYIPKVGIIISVFFLLSLAVFAEEVNYKIEKDIAYYSDAITDTNEYIAERCKLDIYHPVNRKGFATVVWFHGGGLYTGNKEIPYELREQGFAIVGVSYRLHPKVQTPAYIKDAAAAVAWVFKNITAYGGDTTAIFISGHSAGGYLTSMVGLDKSYLEEHGVDANNIAGLIPYSGHTITHFTVRKEQGIKGTQPIIDKYAPLYHVRNDAPPYILITGDRELELLGRYEENAYMYRMMIVVGHSDTHIYELKGLGHGMAHKAHPILIQWVHKILEDNKK